MTAALACIYGLGMLLLALVFLIEWLRNRRHITKYLSFGIIAGAVVLGFDALMFVITAVDWSALGILFALVVDALVFTRIVGFTMLGMHYCAGLGYPSFPLLERRLGVQRFPTSQALPPSVEGSATNRFQGYSTWSTEWDVTERNRLPESSSTAPVAPELYAREYITSLLTVVALSVAYSVFLFSLSQPRISETAKRAFGASSFEEGSGISLPTVVFVVVFAFSEEIIFRLGIQNFLAQRLGWHNGRYWIAIGVTALLWTFGHVGTIEPGWVKLAQVYPIGLMLGWLFKEYGVEASILAHAMFNVILIVPSSSLIK
jgi:membrane protease YdiL (CAAX protease family)